MQASASQTHSFATNCVSGGLELQSKAGAHDAAGCKQTERQMERLNAVNLAGIYLYYIRLKDDYIEIMAEIS